MGYVGYIYFVQRLCDSAIKIGHTLDVKYRMYDLRCKFGTITLMHSMRGGVQTEKRLHNKFYLDSLGNEWFKTSKSIIDYINSLRSLKTTNS